MAYQQFLANFLSSAHFTNAATGLMALGFILFYYFEADESHSIRTIIFSFLQSALIVYGFVGLFTSLFFPQIFQKLSYSSWVTMVGSAILVFYGSKELKKIYISPDYGNSQETLDGISPNE